MCGESYIKSVFIRLNNNTKLMKVVVRVISVENECVDCGLPCLYMACPYYRVIRLYCDRCKQEAVDLWHFDSKQLCVDCILEQLEKVDIDEIDQDAQGVF